TTVLASASGFTPALATVIVSVPGISVTLDSPTIGLTRTTNGTVTLSAPAPAGGVTIDLSSNPAGIVTLNPQSVNIGGGNPTAPFTVTGVAVGATTITAVLPGYNSGFAQVSVGSLGAIVLPAGVTVGPNQSTAFPISLATAAPAGGATITLTSSDTTVL